MIEEKQWLDNVELRFNEDGTPSDAANIRFIRSITRDGDELTRTYYRRVLTRFDDLSAQPAALQNILREHWAHARTDADLFNPDS